MKVYYSVFFPFHMFEIFYNQNLNKEMIWMSGWGVLQTCSVVKQSSMVQNYIYIKKKKH